MRIAQIHVMLMLMNDRKSANALYAFTIPAFIRTLKVVNAILIKAERHAKRGEIEPATLLEARLYPNMYTLLQQIQYLCFLPVDFATNFSTSAAPRVGYDERTFADLKASIKQTIKYLHTLKPSQFAVHEDTQLPLFFDQSSGLPAEAYATRVNLARLLLSRDNCLRHIAAQWFTAWQNGFFRATRRKTSG